MSTNLSFSNNSAVNSRFSTVNDYDCYITNPNQFIFITFTITQVVVLFPLCISILYLGFQQLQQNHSSVTISHSDCFTYHMVTMELIGVFGCIVSFIGNCMKNLEMLNTGLQIFWFTWYGQISFHTLTCLERYLAVVHPITYLSLKNGKGIQIRNISICCSWLLCFVGIGVLTTGTIFWDICLLMIATATIFFFSISVLCVLIRPGPGEQGSERKDQSKHRAFYIIVVILGFLILRVPLGLAWAFLDLSGDSTQCMLMLGSVWISLPSSLLLPLLYLERTGKLVCCKDILKRSTP